MANEPDWITTPHIPVDYRGPTDRPFTPFGDPADATPMIERLASVAAYSQHLAVVDDQGSLTYGQLLRSIYRLAESIERLRAAPGPVAIVLPTGRAYVIAVYACLAARRMAVLLDAGYPRARNAEIAAATGVTLILTEGPDFIAESDLAVLRVDLIRDDEAALDPVAIAAAREMLDVDAPAFILCTSGSTGHPKAIVHSQRTMLNFARAAHDAYHIDENDRVLAISSLSSLGGIAPVLHLPLAGATLHLMDIKARGISGLLGDLINFPISILGAAPSLLRGIARLPEASQAFARLRIVQTYGESFTKDDLRVLRAVIPPNCYIRTAYGATEAGGMSWYAEEGDAQDPVRVAAGTLMPDTAAALVDATGAHCARGEVGELLLRSRYNALGEYIDRKLVAGRLEVDPKDAKRRIYRTGDLARCDDEGVFVVLGRGDRMLNINGQRVEPAESEFILRRHADVERAEVLACQRSNATVLVAFVVAMPGKSAGLERTLRDQLRGSLPSFMVPARILLMEKMPLLPGGKIDAQALRALAGGFT